MPDRHHDICIVGGSIAGATLACHLAREGFSVCLFERRKRGARKLCAELAHVALLDRVEQLTGCACPDAVSARLGRVEVHAGPFVLGRGFELGRGVTVDRVRLEAALLDRALQLGATVVEPQPVRQVTVSSTGVAVATADIEVTGDVVVGADGAASLVGRTLSRPWRREEIGATRHARLALAPEQLPDGASTMRFDLLSAASGYGWLVPYAEEVGVGAGALSGPLDQQFAELLSRYGDEYGLDIPGLARGSIRGAPVPAAGPSRPTWGERFLLVGDAGGFVSPASGEGMALALESVVAAASALKLCFLTGRFRGAKLRHYERLWRKSMPDFEVLIRLRDATSGARGLRLLERCTNDLERLTLLAPLVGSPDLAPQAEQIITRLGGRDVTSSGGE